MTWPAEIQRSTASADPFEPWLTPRCEMAFRPSARPIEGPVLKLGGQPVWLDEPFWPTSSTLGTPMTFVGQFPVPGPAACMSYLFLTQDDDAMAATYEPEAGENALIVQPDGRVPSFLTGVAASTGPTLWRRGDEWTRRIPVELSVDVRAVSESAEAVFQRKVAVQRADRLGVFVDDDAGGYGYRSYLGGPPLCWQPAATVVVGGWRFFFQLDGAEGWGDDPYALNFGGGTGYAFLSDDEREGRFWWDCV